MTVAPNPGWETAFACSQWISNANTGDPTSPGFVTVPNGTTVSFTSQVFINDPLTAWLDFGADDTGQALINGVLVVDFATGVGNTYNHCSDFSPGCVGSTEISAFDILAFVHPGWNSIQLIAKQVNSSSFGVDGRVYGTDTVADTPEPGTWALMGVGLTMFGIIRKKKKPTA